MLKRLEEQEQELLKLLNEAQETKQKAEEDLTEFRAERNAVYTEMSRLDIESRMNKSFKDPCLMDSPKSYKLQSSQVLHELQSKTIPKKQRKTAAGHSQTANPRTNNALRTMQAALAQTIKPYDKVHQKQEPFRPSSNYKQLDDAKSVTSGFT